MIFALADGNEVGFSLFFHNFSTFLGRAGIYLEDLYVKPEYRGKGFGKALLKKLASIAAQRGCGRLEWWCLDSNRPSIDFYLSLGAEPMSDLTVYRIDGDTLNTDVWKHRGVGARRCGFNAESRAEVRGENLYLTAEYLEDGKFGAGWYSGMISLKQHYLRGYFEIRCKCNKDKGFWSAFWIQSPSTIPMTTTSLRAESTMLKLISLKP